MEVSDAVTRGKNPIGALHSKSRLNLKSHDSATRPHSFAALLRTRQSLSVVDVGSGGMDILDYGLLRFAHAIVEARTMQVLHPLAVPVGETLQVRALVAQTTNVPIGYTGGSRFPSGVPQDEGVSRPFGSTPRLLGSVAQIPGFQQSQRLRVHESGVGEYSYNRMSLCCHCSTSQSNLPPRESGGLTARQLPRYILVFKKCSDQEHTVPAG